MWHIHSTSTSYDKNTHTNTRRKGNRREPSLGLHFRALAGFVFLMHLPCIPYIYPPPVLFQTRLSGSEGTANKRLREMFIAVSITDLKLYFFLGETMKHEKRRQKGRDNRHSRHIKTQPGRRSEASGAARRTQIAEQSSPMCCGTAQWGRRRHCLQSLKVPLSALDSFTCHALHEGGGIICRRAVHKWPNLHITWDWNSHIQFYFKFDCLSTHKLPNSDFCIAIFCEWIVLCSSTTW